MNRWLINLVLGYLLTQLAKWKELFDWAKFKEEADAYIRDLVPGTWFDAMAERIANTVIDAAAAVLGDKAHLDVILKALSAGDYAAALVALRQMLEAIWRPGAISVFGPTTATLHLANDLAAGHDDLVGTRPADCTGAGCHEGFVVTLAAPSEIPAAPAEAAKGKRGKAADA